jgi:ubiquinone/menaquinone biosynthesis C-methylase UbiE
VPVQSFPANTDVLPDYRFDPVAYEEEERARPDEMEMIAAAGRAAARLMDGMDDVHLLDLCCGTGLPLSSVSAHARLGRAVGVDNCAEYLAFARDRFAATPRVAFIEDDAVTAELPMGAWDIILMCSAYHHIEDRRKLEFLHKARRLLTPRGRIVMAENVLPPYRSRDRQTYRAAVSWFYREVLRECERSNPTMPAHITGLIQRVAQYGHDGDYEYKVNMTVLRRHLAAAQLDVVDCTKVWPTSGLLALTDGGNYILVLQATTSA